MADPVGLDIPHLLDDKGLREWIAVQRWYASKSRTISAVEIVEKLGGRKPTMAYPPATTDPEVAAAVHELVKGRVGDAARGGIDPHDHAHQPRRGGQEEPRPRGRRAGSTTAHRRFPRGRDRKPRAPRPRLPRALI